MRPPVMFAPYWKGFLPRGRRQAASWRISRAARGVFGPRREAYVVLDGTLAEAIHVLQVREA